jgi:pimeloyl-ACP methyl ester carboxylesterase
MIELQSRAPLSRYAFIGLHGALMEAASLLPLGNVLAEAGDGLLLDLGGHGSALDQALTGLASDSESLGRELCSRPSLTGWLARLPEDRPLVLLGHSLGALVAIWLARFGPLRGRIANVILLDPPLVLDLSVPGQGELLFDLGLNLGAQTPVASPVLPTAEQLRAYGLASFFLGLFRDSQAAQAGRSLAAWLEQLARTIPCDLIVGLRHQVVFSAEGFRLDLGTLVGPAHVPSDLPLLRLHGVANAGHRLDTSAATRRLIAQLVPDLGNPVPAHAP